VALKKITALRDTTTTTCLVFFFVLPRRVRSTEPQSVCMPCPWSWSSLPLCPPEIQTDLLRSPQTRAVVLTLLTHTDLQQTRPVHRNHRQYQHEKPVLTLRNLLHQSRRQTDWRPLLLTPVLTTTLTPLLLHVVRPARYVPTGLVPRHSRPRHGCCCCCRRRRRSPGAGGRTCHGGINTKKADPSENYKEKIFGCDTTPI